MIEVGDTIRVNPEFVAAYRKVFENHGQRHRNAARWMWDLGWSIDRRALEEYLAPEFGG